MLREPANDSALPLIGIYEISKILGATLDLDKALHDVLNVLSSFLQMRHGTVVLRDGEGNAVLAAVSGLDEAVALGGVEPLYGPSLHTFVP